MSTFWVIFPPIYIFAKKIDIMISLKRGIPKKKAAPILFDVVYSVWERERETERKRGREREREREPNHDISRSLYFVCVVLTSYARPLLFPCGDITAEDTGQCLFQHQNGCEHVGSTLRSSRNSTLSWFPKMFYVPNPDLQTHLSQ